MSASMKVKIVNVKVEHDPTGMFVATSPEMKGLLVAKQDMKSLNEAIPGAIASLYAACGVDVWVTPAEDGSEFDSPWVAVPAEIAKQALVHA